MADIGSVSYTSFVRVPTDSVKSVTSAAIKRTNGSVQVLTLSANSTLTADIGVGESVTVMVLPTTYTLNISGFTLANQFTGVPTNKLVTLVLSNVNGTKYLYGTIGGA